MRLDAQETETLDREECLSALRSVTLGRVVFTDRALPAVQPVSFLIDGDDIVLYTEPGSRLGTAMRNSVVAFEADHFDETTGYGWSVTVIGHTRIVADDRDARHLTGLSARRWTPHPGDRYVRISCTHLTGRRIGPPSGMATAPPHKEAS